MPEITHARGQLWYSAGVERPEPATWKTSASILLGVFAICAGVLALVHLSSDPSFPGSIDARPTHHDLGHVSQEHSAARDDSTRLRAPRLDSPAGSHPSSLAPPAGDHEQTDQGRPESQSERFDSRVVESTLPAGSGGILFTIEDGSGQPASGVSVILNALPPSEAAKQAITSSRGTARFLGLAAGSYVYQARGLDGERTEGATSLLEGERKPLTIRLGGRKSSIRGRVINRDGEAVPGIGVYVLRHRLAATVVEEGPEMALPRRTRSRTDGSFVVQNLEAGEYEIQTQNSDRYSSSKRLVQAGSGPVDLVVLERIQIQGSVSNTEGELLAGVQIRLLDDGSRMATTDHRGAYRLDWGLTSGGAPRHVRFSRPGYENVERIVAAPAQREPGPLGLDIVMRAVDQAAQVSGVVRSDRGKPVAGATVVLGSSELTTNYQTTSENDGSFAIPLVKVGRGYQLRVLPPGGFRDFSRSRIRVPEAGLSLDVPLEPLPTGRISGRMVDASGAPVPGVRIWLLTATATRAAVPITSDERGFFEVEEAPAGPLLFDTRSLPRLTVDGLALSPGDDRDVLLLIDAGDHVMAGHVVDDRGKPKAGAKVVLSWSHASGNVRSTSRRETHTDAAGSFRFTRLGPGEHSISIQAPDYQTRVERRDVGRNTRDLEVQLEPKQR